MKIVLETVLCNLLFIDQVFGGNVATEIAYHRCKAEKEQLRALNKKMIDEVVDLRQQLTCCNADLLVARNINTKQSSRASSVWSEIAETFDTSESSDSEA